MSTPVALTIFIDGAARGNPGPAAFAYVIEHEGEVVLDGNGTLGNATNNVAEYTALIEALKKAAELKAVVVHIRSDSELLVKQMNGQYRVKNANLIPLYQEAKRLARQFQLVDYAHVPREENREADRLCNEALDGRSPAAGGRAPAKARPKAERRLPPADQPPASDSRHALADAERMLRQAAQVWAENGLENPTPHQIFQQMIELLEQRGVVRR